MTKKFYTTLAGAVASAAMGVGLIALNQLGAAGHLSGASDFVVAIIAAYLWLPLTFISLLVCGDLILQAIRIRKETLKAEKRKQQELQHQRELFHLKMEALRMSGSKR